MRKLTSKERFAQNVRDAVAAGGVRGGTGTETDPKVTPQKSTMTREQLMGLIGEVVGEEFKKLDQRIADDRNDERKEIEQLIKNFSPAEIAKASRKSGRVKDASGLDAIRFMQCLGNAKGNKEEAAKLAKAMGDERVEKALNSADASAGGVLVEPEFAEEFVDFLRAQTVVMESGARTMGMDSGILNLKRAASGAVAAYRGESTNATVSEPTTEEITLNARILDVLTPVSNQLMSRSGGRAEEFVRDDLVDAAGDKMDSTFIRSDGSSDRPKGLLFWADPANKFNETNGVGTTGASTTAEIINDLGTAIQLLLDSNLRMTRVGWLFSNRTWKRLFTELDSNSNFVFRLMLEANSLFGFPFKMTTNIPNNLTADAGSGGGTDASEVYLCDFFNIIVGETEALRVRVSEEAAYDTGSGLVSAFQRGEMLIKVEMEHDLVARRGGSEIVVIESATWGTV